MYGPTKVRPHTLLQESGCCPKKKTHSCPKENHEIKCQFCDTSLLNKCLHGQQRSLDNSQRTLIETSNKIDFQSLQRSSCSATLIHLYPAAPARRQCCYFSVGASVYGCFWNPFSLSGGQAYSIVLCDTVKQSAPPAWACSPLGSLVTCLRQD